MSKVFEMLIEVNHRGLFCCEECNEFKENVTLVVCPYTQEIHDKIIPVLLCGACLKTRMDEI